MNGVCLFYVSYAQQLQLLHLVLVYEKEVVFVPKKGQIIVKIDGLASSYKTDRPRAKSDMSQKENQNWRRYRLNLLCLIFLME